LIEADAQAGDGDGESDVRVDGEAVVGRDGGGGRCVEGEEEGSVRKRVEAAFAWAGGGEAGGEWFSGGGGRSHGRGGGGLRSGISGGLGGAGGEERGEGEESENAGGRVSFGRMNGAEGHVYRRSEVGNKVLRVFTR